MSNKSNQHNHGICIEFQIIIPIQIDMETHVRSIS